MCVRVDVFIYQPDVLWFPRKCQIVFQCKFPLLVSVITLSKHQSYLKSSIEALAGLFVNPDNCWRVEGVFMHVGWSFQYHWYRCVDCFSLWSHLGNQKLLLSFYGCCIESSLQSAFFPFFVAKYFSIQFWCSVDVQINFELHLSTNKGRFISRHQEQGCVRAERSIIETSGIRPDGQWNSTISFVASWRWRRYFIGVQNR